MPVLRKRAQAEGKVANGLYVHSSPPRVLQPSSAYIKQLIRSGDIDKIEQAVLEGHGKKLVGEYSADYKTRTFLKSVPALMSKILLLHDAVNSGKLEELQSVLEEEPDKKKKFVAARDESGVGLLHKAIYYDIKDIYKWLIDKFPNVVSIRDSEGRTPYHYTPMCKDPNTVQKLLTNAGADPSTLDVHQHSAKYYMDHKQELELPSTQKSTTNSRKSTGKRDSINFKKSNIRIWIHQRNLTNLQQVVWEGHGSKLLVEHSNNPKIKKFLEAVPHIMGLIKEIHVDVQNGDLDGLKNHVRSPIPSVVLSGKDANGLTSLHKAAGLGRENITKFIVEEYPQSVNITDNDGRTPLHYAAILKDDGKMMNFLIENGCDESTLDNKQKTAAYYKTRHSEIDAKLLNVVPECPRHAKESFAANFDWTMLANAPINGVNAAVKKVQNSLKDTTDNEKENHNELPEKDEKNGHEEIVKEIEHAGGVKEMEHAAENVTEMEHVEENTETDNVEEKENNEKHAISKDETEEGTKSNNENKVEENHIDGEVENKAEDPRKEKEEAVETNDDEENKIHEKSEENREPEEDELKKETNKNLEKNDEIKENEEENNKLKDINEPDQNKEEPKENIATNAEQDPNESNALNEQSGEERPKSIKSHTRPSSKNDAKSRPSSKINSSKTNSKMVEIDENQNEQKNPVVESESVIEGVVNGEHENETEGQNQRNVSAGEGVDEIKGLVEAGNMEQLATMVLNGQGERLIGYTSDNPELQAFLENVPVYMSKVNQIHESARNGSLRGLQAALDRRKFAIAKDQISPNGASPLHVAVIFGNTSIVRYLAGRFPETVQVVDDNGRTPLHYAAVLADNGHYYNLLVHLGADPRIEDKFGHSPEYYKKDQNELSHKALLREFGAEENEAEEILTDKDNNIVAENGQVDMPFFATEEGRYLASSLGDPLIKGLTEVANKRPEDPIAYLAQYLYNFANNRTNLMSRGRLQESQQIIQGSPTLIDDNNAVPATIDVVTVEPDEGSSLEDSAFHSTSRDEHGQSMLHFAAARAHGRNALFQLLQETDINIGYRDELYRTARDISIQANIPENTEEINRYILNIATNGDTDKLVELLLEGYDHITDIVDDEDVSIVEVVSKAGKPEAVSFLQSVLAFEEKRERVHHAIRQGSVNDVTLLLADENDTGSGKLLAIGKNNYGRCSLHIAVLCQQEEIVDYLASTFKDTLKLGDNLERTALHYAMGIEKMETISRLLIKAGAERVAKDLKGRQPTYYFLNKSDILRLQEEEETF